MSSSHYDDSSNHDEAMGENETTLRQLEDSETSASCGQSKMSAEEERQIVQKETSVVIRLRLIVFLTLVASATVVAESVYLHLFVTEQDNFHTAFKDDSEKLLEAIGTSLDKSFGLLDSLAVLFISFSRVTNQTWPFVTMPDFAVRMAKIVPLTDSISVNILPVVTSEQRSEWEDYTLGNDEWVNEGMRVQENWDWYYGPVVYNGSQFGAVHSDFETVPETESRDMLPNWQNFPVIPNTTEAYNTDYLTRSFADGYKKCLQHHSTVVTTPYMLQSQRSSLEQAETSLWAEYYRNFISLDENSIEPMSDMVIPIVDDISQVAVAGADNYDPSKNKVVGVIAATFYWRAVIQNILPKESDGIRIVFENKCSDPFTYQINGPEVQFLGPSDYHDEEFDDMVLVRTLHELGNFSMRKSMYTGPRLDEEYCTFTLRVYPSNTMKSKYVTNNPVIFTTVTVLIFVFTSFVFFFYDFMVEKRQRAVMQTAAHSSAIVSSLFPSAVRDRLFPVEETKKPNRLMRVTASKTERQSLTSTAFTDSTEIRGSPIAEMYPDTTVLFADVAGFTAWSSERSPTQVFHLLETLYAAFDKIAKQRGVFKVETIGDCYVAVVGLPIPRKMHAVVMARFAIDCRNTMQELTSKLEESLGPGTRELALRIGMNSGPTTAGVLRGEKSRFQLFGDTVNTAARMETSGQLNRIHVSEKTAALIRLAGKGHWLQLREEAVNCKGKGLMTTYWCEPKPGSFFSSEASTTATMNELKPGPCFSSEASTTATPTEPKTRSCLSSDESTTVPPNESLSAENLDRLIAWNCDIFTEMMGHVVDQRIRNVGALIASDAPRDDAQVHPRDVDQLHPRDDVVEVIAFPRTSTGSGGQQNHVKSKVSFEGSKQMREFITEVAHLYQKHPFHNFEHCSHVVMATKSMLDMITERPLATDMTCSSLLSHPITRFGIHFAALVHDVDHPGVSNSQLAHEQHDLARKYKAKSIAEQNSIDIAWDLLMQKRFTVLRDTMFESESDLQHFRKVVVNVVLATDLFDSNLRALRDSRWVKSFATDGLYSDALDRRTTSILDLIIQASDVSHTMQHFSVFRKWNKRLLIEMYEAYKKGRMTKDPTEEWYEGELWFFDNYVIPLTKKLRECGIFGSACDKFSNYAIDNRMEWKLNGRAILREIITEDLKLRFE